MFRTYFVDRHGDEAMGAPELPRHDCARAPGELEDSPEGYSQTPPYRGGTGTTNGDAGRSPSWNARDKDDLDRADPRPRPVDSRKD